MRPSIQQGELARRDPIVAFASVMASNLLLQASSIPPRRRMSWLRGELNKVQPGLGDDFVSKTRQLRRQGSTPDQGAYDALRVVLANRVAKGTEKVMEKRNGVSGLSGLGADPARVQKGFCGVIGLAGAGGTIAAGFKNPSASPAIGEATASALQSMGCNDAALEEQRKIAEAQAAAAQAQAAAAAAQAGSGDDKTMTYVAIGGGVLLVGLLGVVALRK